MKNKILKISLLTTMLFSFSGVALSADDKLVLDNPSEVLSKLSNDIDDVTAEENLYRQEQGRSLLLREQMKTAILQERLNQLKVIEDGNKMKLDRKKELEKMQDEVEKRLADKKKAEEDEKNRQNVSQYPTLQPQIQQYQQYQQYQQPVIEADVVSVLSVYGMSDDLTAEVKVNDNKYQVKKGQYFSSGFKVLEINDAGVKIEKDSHQQFINVSAPPVSIIGMPVSQVQEVRTPNVIIPYELGK